MVPELDGVRSFTTNLGHSWQFALQPWFQQMLLNAIEWTAGLQYANCVSFSEVSELIDAAAAAGDLDADAETRLDALLGEGRAQLTTTTTSRPRRRSASW